jgi:hypothetical protein
MLKSNVYLYPNRLGEAAIHASRQMWLASLGAAVVTRDWVQTEAGGVFRNLVKEGTVIESRAMRFVGDRIENSVSFANSMWKDTRRSVESTVKQAADAAVTIAQQVLPKSLPAFEIPGAPRTRKANRRTTKSVTKSARTAAVKRAKRVRKAATKRA